VTATSSQGAREKIPEEWPRDLELLVRDCWNQDPNQRPDFGEVYRRCAGKIKSYTGNES